MPEPSAHAKLAADGMQQSLAGRFDAAIEAFASALALAPPTDRARTNYHLGLAAALLALERHAEVRDQYELALKAARASADGETDEAIGVAGFFLGIYCVRRGDFAKAMDAVTPSIEAGTQPRSSLLMVRALALQGLGRMDQACSTAEEAIAAAADDASRKRMQMRLKELLPA